jgi:hypothetical protein
MQIGSRENDLIWLSGNRDELIQNLLHGPTEFSAGFENL